MITFIQKSIEFRCRDIQGFLAIDLMPAVGHIGPLRTSHMILGDRGLYDY